MYANTWLESLPRPRHGVSLVRQVRPAGDALSRPRPAATTRTRTSQLADSLADKVDARRDPARAASTRSTRRAGTTSGVHPAVRAARHAQYDAYLRQRAGAVHLQPRPARRPGGLRRELRRVSRREFRGALSGRRQPRHLLLRRLRHPLVHSTATGTTTATSTARPRTSRTWTANWPASSARVGWVIATGEHDSLVQKNREFSDMLSGRRGSRTTSRSGRRQFGHDWPWWREHLRRFV